MTRGRWRCRLLNVSDLVGQTRHDEAVALLLAFGIYAVAILNGRRTGASG